MIKSTIREGKEAKRMKIVTVYDCDGDWRSKAKELEVPVSTAYRWVGEGMRKDTRGGKTYTKVMDHHRQSMVKYVEGMYDLLCFFLDYSA